MAESVNHEESYYAITKRKERGKRGQKKASKIETYQSLLGAWQTFRFQTASSARAVCAPLLATNEVRHAQCSTSSSV